MVKTRGNAFQVDFRWKGRRIRKGGFSTREEAQTWEAKALDRLSKGLPVEEVVASSASGNQWTLATLRDAVETKYWRGSKNEVNAVRIADEAVEFFGEETPPEAITALEIDRWTRHLVEKGNSPGTINRKLSVLGKMLRYALTRGLIMKMPVIEKRKEPQGRIRWYTPEEERRVLDYCEKHDPDFGDLFTFLVDTGCRLSEACGLRWQDVDSVHARFHYTKGGRSRAVPLTKRLREMLTARKERLPHGPTDPVFPFWDKHKAGRRWKEIREKPEVHLADKEAVLHACRHTCASRLVQAGVPIQVVQQWLGHATIQMTLRYAHLAPYNLTQAVGVLERVVEQTAPTASQEKTA